MKGVPLSSFFKLVEVILILSSKWWREYAWIPIFFLTYGKLMTQASVPFSVNDLTYSLKIGSVNDIWKYLNATPNETCRIRSVNGSRSRHGFTTIRVSISFLTFIYRLLLIFVYSVAVKAIIHTTILFSALHTTHIFRNSWRSYYLGLWTFPVIDRTDHFRIRMVNGSQRQELRLFSVIYLT